MAVLIKSSYGKGNVKFLKVRKDSADPKVQEVLEANVQVLLRGDFDVSYTEADNSPIVPTDTVKNTILVEAKTTDVWPIERFAGHLARHFTEKYPQVHGVDIEIVQSIWTKYQLANGTTAKHSFKHDGPEVKVTNLDYDKFSKKLTLSSTIKDLTVLKSTGSMFYGFNVCDYTILKPTKDRILSTDIDCQYTFKDLSLNDVEVYANAGKFDNAYNVSRQVTLDKFALENSASVQATMYNMSKDILATVPEIKEITYQLPNKHYIAYNLEWKGIKDNSELFYPAPDPNGQIRSTVAREKSKL